MRRHTVLKHPRSFRLLAACTALLLWIPAVAVPAADAPPPPPKDPPQEAERSTTGLASLRLAEGFGKEPPDANDFVFIHYTGWTPAGAKIDSSHDRGQPTFISLERVSPGWREGFQLMVAGEKRRLWVPARLGMKNPKTGPGNTDVIFDVELLGITRVPSPPAGHPEPPADATRTDYGAFVKVVEASDGDAYSETFDSALIEYTMWTRNGKVFDTSVTRNRPTLFPLAKVMPAFSDCLKRMKKGEKSLIWIPGNVANGEWVRSPKGPLVFEVKLIDFMDSGLAQAAAAMPQGDGTD